jgi:selenocysteine lyase/cysteine desulfurase
MPVTRSESPARDAARRTLSCALEALRREERSACEVASSERYWAEVRLAYPSDDSSIRLNHAALGERPVFHPAHTEDSSGELCPEVQREQLAELLGQYFGASRTELSFTSSSSSSEALDGCLDLLRLSPGDEVVTLATEYSPNLRALRHRAERDGVRLRLVDLPGAQADESDVVERFLDLFGHRTRVVVLSHIVSLTGQILPIAAIAKAAREFGIAVFVDGAQSLAHLDFKISDLGCDGFTGSLSKWLGAPLGAGLLYRRRGGPFDGPRLTGAGDALDLLDADGVLQALEYHCVIGTKRKQLRTAWLRDRWALRLMRTGRVRIYSCLAPGRSAGFATLQVIGTDSRALAEFLWRTHRIEVPAISVHGVSGVRVAPAAYSRCADVDHFAGVIEDVCRNGIPKSS